MIEKIILDYLREAIDVKVCMERPPKPPKRYVLIEKTGSSESNDIYMATIAIQSYAESMYAAAALNEAVKEAMHEADTLDDITDVNLNSDYNFTNTATKEYRYQAVFDITHY